MAYATKPASFNLSFFDEAAAARNFQQNRIIPIGYTRLSFDEDGENFCSIVNQTDIIKVFAKERLHYNGEITVIPDDDISGYSFERQGFFELLHFIETGRCNTILSKDLSRIGRHSALTQLFIGQCERIGIRIIAIDDYDSSKENDDMILGIRTWSNERVVKDASAKVKRIVNMKQRNGTWFCSVPFGYRAISYKEKVFEIDPIAEPVIKRIDNMYCSGIGMKKIGIILTEEGIITPSMRARDIALENGKTYRGRVSNKWASSQVQTILKDDFYIGTFRTNKYERKEINGKDVRLPESEHHVFENHHPAIRSAETHRKIQEIRSNAVKFNYKGAKRRENVFHGILRCGECGEVLFAYRRKDLDPQYVCSTYFRYNKYACSRHMIKEKIVMQIALDYLEMVKLKCESIMDTIDVDLSHIRRSSVKEESIESLKSGLNQLKSELNAVETQRIKQIIAHPERESTINEIYDDLYSNVEKKINSTLAKISSIENAEAEASSAKKKAKTALEIIEHVVSCGEITRLDAELLFEKIVVYEDGRVEVTLSPDLSPMNNEPYVIIDKAKKQRARRYEVVDSGANVVAEGDPPRTTFASDLGFIRETHTIAIQMQKNRE